jgi:hypothetical protein
MIRDELFTRYFPEHGIREMDQYRCLTAAEVTALADAIREHWAHLEQMPRPLEAETEVEFIFPILSLLGQLPYLVNCFRNSVLRIEGKKVIRASADHFVSNIILSEIVPLQFRVVAFAMHGISPSRMLVQQPDIFRQTG